MTWSSPLTSSPGCGSPSAAGTGSTSSWPAVPVRLPGSRRRTPEAVRPPRRGAPRSSPDSPGARYYRANTRAHLRLAASSVETVPRGSPTCTAPRHRRSRAAPPGRAATPARCRRARPRPRGRGSPTRPPSPRRPRGRRPGARAGRPWPRRRCGRRSRGSRRPRGPPVRERVARARVTSFWSSADSSGAASVTDGLLRRVLRRAVVGVGVGLDAGDPDGPDLVAPARRSPRR